MRHLAFVLIATVIIAPANWWSASFCSADEPAQILKPRVYRLQPGPDVQFEFQERLINSVPGDVLELAAGNYQFTGEINVTCDNITIRGAGPDATILSFAGQDVGSEGIVATGDAFVIEDLAVVDSVGNAIKVLGSDGVIFRNVRTEWTRGPNSENGAYGIYPVQCRNVLIDGCIAKAASDAGIYVGQSENVIVRNSRAELNVAGIEIENTTRADVYDNVATNNTGGILVFDLPGLQKVNGREVRVFQNRIVGNNIANFAPPGNMVATVPPGTGLMIMATDAVQVFKNTIADNQTMGIGIVSFLITQRPLKNPEFDPYPDEIYISANTLKNNGSSPSGTFGKVFSVVLGASFPEIVYDGIVNPKGSR